MDKPIITVDIVSDVVCPWCYIGKKRLEQAMHRLSDKFEFQIRYLPFELNPNVPNEGYDHKSYLSKKFGGEDRYEQLSAQVAEVAAQEGLLFNFKIQKKLPNTFDAHRIIWLAEKEGKQLQTVEAFFKAYFTNGIDLTQRENLLQIANEAGLYTEAVKKLLESEVGRDDIRTLQSYNQTIGVTGVPFYIINNKYAISGAQPATLFENAFQEIGNENVSNGTSCDIDGNC